MQTQAEQRREIFWRVVRYSIMVLAIVVLTTFLFFIMLGYRFNRDNGTLVQGGLVQFISQPTGARVSVGSAQLANLTRSKITLYPGDYLVKMERDGYNPWQKDITVRPGTVLWLDSARLVPTNRTTTPMQNFTALDDTLARASGDYLALLEDDTKPVFQTARLNDADTLELKTITVPSSLVATKKGAKHRYDLKEWSRDDRYVMVEHRYGKEREYLRVDVANPERTTAIRPLSGAQPVEAFFDPRSGVDMIARYDDGLVYLVTSDGKKELLLEDAASIATAKGSLLLYSTLPKDGVVTTGYLSLGRAKTKQLATYETTSPVSMALGEYYFENYLATAVGKNVTIEKIGDVPASDSDSKISKTSVAQFELEGVPLEVATRNRDRLMAFAGRSEMVVYDLELNKKSQAVIQGDKRLAEAPMWLDGQHFWSDANGSLRMYEYDGTNQADIASVTPGYAAMYSSSGKYLFSITKSGKNYVLQRTLMIL